MKELVLITLGCIAAVVNGSCTNLETGLCINPYFTNTVGFEFPVPSTTADQISGLCTLQSTLTRCLDQHRADCAFDVERTFSPYESVSKYICDNKSEYQKYLSIVSNVVTRQAWDVCFAAAQNIFGGVPSTSNTVICSSMRVFVECMVTASTAGGDTSAGEYFKGMAYVALVPYDREYSCGYVPSSYHTGKSAAAKVPGTVWHLSLFLAVFKCFCN